MARHATPEELGMATDEMITHMPIEEEGAKEVEIEESTSDIEIEVVDDRTEDEKEHEPKKISDEELAELGARSQKRIKQLTRQKHDERRRAEAAEREREEAVAYAKRVMGDAEKTRELLKKTQDALNTQAVKRAEAATQAAEQRYKIALETGDPDQIAEAHKSLTNATMAQQYAPQVAKRYEEKWSADLPRGDDKTTTDGERALPEAPEPDPRTKEWHTANPWFGEDRVMTSAAFGIHETLIIDEGVTPQSEEYWETLDQRLRELFPSKYEASSDTDATEVTQDAASQPAAQGRVDTVVAPATRNTSAKAPRKIVLTESQVRIAKRLGVSIEDYARQVLKEQAANG